MGPLYIGVRHISPHAIHLQAQFDYQTHNGNGVDKSRLIPSLTIHMITFGMCDHE